MATRKPRTTTSTTDDNENRGKKEFETSSTGSVPSTCPLSSHTPHSTPLRRAGLSSIVDSLTDFLTAISIVKEGSCGVESALLTIDESGNGYLAFKEVVGLGDGYIRDGNLGVTEKENLQVYLDRVKVKTRGRVWTTA